MSEQLKNRTKKFALDVVLLCAGFPYVIETRHAIGQVIRSSSSVAANYRSACRGKSKADFISKLGTVEEEADETCFWLEMIIAAKLMNPARINPVLQEANELTAIAVATRKTAVSRRQFR